MVKPAARRAVPGRSWFGGTWRAPSSAGILADVVAGRENAATDSTRRSGSAWYEVESSEGVKPSAWDTGDLALGGEDTTALVLRRLEGARSR